MNSLNMPLSPIFSFYLGKGASSSGMLTFGGYDLEKYAESSKPSDIFWSKASDFEKYWSISMDTVALVAKDSRSDL